MPSPVPRSPSSAQTKIQPTLQHTILSTHTLTAAALLTGTVLIGIIYSLIFNTSLDTSNPLLAHLPHPSSATTYFANKSNIFNQLFVKRAWAWTTLAFLAVHFTSPSKVRSGRRLVGWAAATAVWLSFGPLFQRVVVLSGGECLIHLPAVDATSSPSTLTVPAQFCHSRASISPLTHPKLFADPTISSFLASPSLNKFNARPKFYHGHDVSGHIFILTLSTLLLLDLVVPSLSYVFKFFAPQTVPTPRPVRASQWHSIAVKSTLGLIGLWWWMTFMTSIYFHTTSEKLSGLAVGFIGYLISQVPAIAL